MGDALHTHGGVTSAQEARLADAGLLAVQGPTPADVRTGVLAGPGTTTLVTGTASTAPMEYAVAAHQWVTSRGTANGPYRGSLDAVQLVATTAAPASGSRIDVVYEKQQDATPGVPTPDATTAPLYGVAQGVSTTGTPAKPALPVGALELATATVAAGATRTDGAGVTITNTARQTVARGAPIPCRNQTERDALTAFPGLRVLRLDQGGAEEWWDGVGWRITVAGNPVIATGTNVSGTDGAQVLTYAATIPSPGGRYRVEANFTDCRLFMNGAGPIRAEVRIRIGNGAADDALPIVTYGRAGGYNVDPGWEVSAPSRVSGILTGPSRIAVYGVRTGGTGSWSLAPGPSVYYRVVPA